MACWCLCLLVLAHAVCHSERLGQPASCVGFRIAHPIIENPKLEPNLDFLLGGFHLCLSPRASFFPLLVQVHPRCFYTPATLRALLMFYVAVAFLLIPTLQWNRLRPVARLQSLPSTALEIVRTHSPPAYQLGQQVVYGC